MPQRLPLDTLTDLARTQTDDAARRLGALQSAQLSSSQKLDLLLQYRQDYYDQLHALMNTGLPTAKWRNYQALPGHARWRHRATARDRRPGRHAGGPWPRRLAAPQAPSQLLRHARRTGAPTGNAGAGQARAARQRRTIGPEVLRPRRQPAPLKPTDSPMPTLISPSLQVQQSAGLVIRPSRPGCRARPKGRSFGAVLDRSRAAGTTAASQEVADTELPSSMSGRKPSRPGERKSELTAADVMAMLAPLPTHLALAPVDGKASAALASRGTKTAGNAVDSIPTTATPALLGGGAVATIEESTGGSPAQSSDGVTAADHDATDAKTEGKPATATDQPFKDALAASAPARPADKPAPDAPALPAVDAPVFTTASAGASKQTTSADKAIVSAVAEKAAPAPQLPASESIKLAAASEPAGAAAIDMAADSGPQAMPQFQSVAVPAADRSNAPTTSTPVLICRPTRGKRRMGPADRPADDPHERQRPPGGGAEPEPDRARPAQGHAEMGDNQAQAMFVSAHESVRKAVEAALPQLRTQPRRTGHQPGPDLGRRETPASTRGRMPPSPSRTPRARRTNPTIRARLPAGSSAAALRPCPVRATAAPRGGGPRHLRLNPSDANARAAMNGSEALFHA